jgi:hypothetical protein
MIALRNKSPLIIKTLLRLQDLLWSLKILCYLDVLQFLLLLHSLSSRNHQRRGLAKKKQPDEIPRPTDRPATRSSSKPTLTKKILTTDEAPKIAKTDQSKKSSWRHGEKDLVDKVSKLS